MDGAESERGGPEAEDRMSEAGGRIPHSPLKKNPRKAGFSFGENGGFEAERRPGARDHLSAHRVATPWRALRGAETARSERTRRSRV